MSQTTAELLTRLTDVAAFRELISASRLNWDDGTIFAPCISQDYTVDQGFREAFKIGQKRQESQA